MTQQAMPETPKPKRTPAADGVELTHVYFIHSVHVRWNEREGTNTQQSFQTQTAGSNLVDRIVDLGPKVKIYKGERSITVSWGNIINTWP